MGCETGMEDMSDWALEEEPQPAVRDSWGRYMLPKRDETKMRSTFASSKDSGFGKEGKRGKTQIARKQTLLGIGLQEDQGKSKKPERPLAWSIDQKPPLDRNEERMREEKMQ